MIICSNICLSIGVFGAPTCGMSICANLSCREPVLVVDDSKLCNISNAIILNINMQQPEQGCFTCLMMDSACDRLHVYPGQIGVHKEGCDQCYI